MKRAGSSYLDKAVFALMRKLNNQILPQPELHCFGSESEAAVLGYCYDSHYNIVAGLFGLQDGTEWDSWLFNLAWSLLFICRAPFSGHNLHRRRWGDKPASLAQLVAWLVSGLGGTGIESRLGWPFISYHLIFVCVNNDLNGSLRINSRLHARLNNQLSHPIHPSIIDRWVYELLDFVTAFSR